MLPAANILWKGAKTGELLRGEQPVTAEAEPAEAAEQPAEPESAAEAEPAEAAEQPAEPEPESEPVLMGERKRADKAAAQLPKTGRRDRNNDILSDVQGSYTGCPVDGGEPVQDADDL